MLVACRITNIHGPHEESPPVALPHCIYTVCCRQWDSFDIYRAFSAPLRASYVPERLVSISFSGWSLKHPVIIALRVWWRSSTPLATHTDFWPHPALHCSMTIKLIEVIRFNQNTVTASPEGQTLTSSQYRRGKSFASEVCVSWTRRNDL